MKFVVKVDSKQDAWNIWQACNKVSHGMDWSQCVDVPIREKIVGQTEAEACSWLVPYLEGRYKELDIDFWAEQIQTELMSEYPKIVQVIEEITQKPLYRKDFTLFVTTINRSPYNFDKGYIWIVFKQDKNKIINTLLHELLHFQFMQYYGDKVWDAVGEQKFQAIKEGMVVILNDYLSEWTGQKEITYTMYEGFADELLKLWHEDTNRQFDEFVIKAIELARTYQFNFN